MTAVTITWSLQRIRGFTTMCYINRLFTNLLTYLLTNSRNALNGREHDFLTGRVTIYQYVYSPTWADSVG